LSLYVKKLFFQFSLICLAVSTKYRRVTDRQTDRRTYILRRHSPRCA